MAHARTRSTAPDAPIGRTALPASRRSLHSHTIPGRLSAVPCPLSPAVMRPFTIDPDIARAQTLPAEVYHDPAWYALQRERVFARSWQLVRGAERVKAPGHMLPFTLLEGCLDEPLVLVSGDDSVVRCLSNVCTHRGTVVCEGETHGRGMRCRYHGRRFALDGKMTFMPEFDGVESFPSPSDDLPRLPLGQWGPLSFTSL